MARKYITCPYCGGDLELSIGYDGCDWDCEKGENSGFGYELQYRCNNDDCATLFPIGRIKNSFDFSESIEKIRGVKLKGNC